MKKVLVIVYYWPPSGGAGVQRWLKFVKYLPQFGWQPTVITTTNGDYPAIDESLCKEVPAGIKVIRTKTPTFGKLFKKINGKNSDVPYGSLESSSKDSLLKKLSFWFRLNLVVPDARKVWNKYAYRAASKELLTNKYDAVVTSGPPHSTHLVGLKLKKKYNIKWIADFRDPWTKIDYLDEYNRWKIIQKIDEKYEKKVYDLCNRFIYSNPLIIKNFKKSTKTYFLSNGYDKDDFKIFKKVKNLDKFEINYFGIISIERNPLSVLKSVNKIFEEKNNRNIRINIWGNIHQSVKDILISNDKNNIVNIHSYIPHKKMVEYLVNSNLLLVVVNKIKSKKGVFPGKIFEYLGSGVEILGIGPEDGDAAKILKETKCGKMFDYDKVDDIANFIEIKYQEWKEGKTFSPSKEVEKYSKIKQTKQLADILEKM
jgi:hypothetical protein